MGRDSIRGIPDISFQYVMSSSLTPLLTGRQVLDAHIMDQYLLIGLLFSHLSSSTFKEPEPLGLKMNFHEMCQVGLAANPSYKTCSSPLNPCCVISMVPISMRLAMWMGIPEWGSAVDGDPDMCPCVLGV